MGYVFRFLKESIERAVCCQKRKDSSEPLVAGDGSNYGSMPDNNNTLGFTDDYVDWSHSNNVILTAQLAFLIYITIAIVGYSFVFENWSIIDSIYFAVTVFTTVGYGDLTPSDDASRLFTVLFAFGGVVILGLFLGIVGSRMFEIHEARVEERLQNVRVKVLEQFSTQDTSKPPTARTFLTDVISIITILSPMLLVLAIIASPIAYLEKEWDPIKGLYWMFMTGTTIGFGDFSPTTPLTKIICILYIPLATAVFGELLSHIAGAYMDRNVDKIEDAFLARALNVGDLEKMDCDKDGIVKPHEFLSYMLVTMQKCEKEDVDEILALFYHLDKDGNGCLNKLDLSNKYNLSIRPGVVATATAE